jgi:anti-anti-sigma factor
MTIERSGDKLTVILDDRLDAATAPSFDASLALEGVRELVLDCSGCSFISSAGIRSILKAKQALAKNQGRLVVTDVPPAVREVFDMTGLSDIIAIRKKIREISLEGRELLSAGVCGECYRIDDETVVKLYNEGVEPHIAEQEKQFAKAAFVMGIPTAISYDVVSCGTRTGIIFELLNAELFSTVIREDLGNSERYAKMLSDTAKTLHAAQGDRTILQSDFLNEKLESLPDDDHCVHFDLHSSNIMVQDGELIIIDMGDLSTGTYLFDIGLIYLIYGIPELENSMLATKIPVEQGLEFWDHFQKHYFADRPAEEKQFFEENRYFLASMRTIHVITYLTHMRPKFERQLTEILLPRIMETRRTAS